MIYYTGKALWKWTLTSLGAQARQPLIVNRISDGALANRYTRDLDTVGSQAQSLRCVIRREIVRLLIK